MNDRDNPYPPYEGDPYGNGQSGQGSGPYELVGYDAYGRPVYQQAQQQTGQQPAVPPPSPQGGGYGYDPYGTYGGQQQGQPQAGYQDYGNTGYDSQGYDNSGYGNPGYDNPAAPQAPGGYERQQAPGAYEGQQAPGAYERQQAPDTRVEEPKAWIPQQQPATPEGPPSGELPRTAAPPRPATPGGPAPGEDPRDYRTEMFSFIEEPTEQSEDVIDWLKFSESRSERREEARRRGRSRVIALVVVLALVVVGGLGYLWYAGKLPGSSDSGSGAADTSGPQNRDVLVVHLRNTKKDGASSTMLLVDNTTAKHGYAVLLPKDLALTDEDGNDTTLGKSVSDDGSSGTSDALDGLLGTEIQGSWRLDTPYLSNLVDLVGTIEVDTDTAVPDPKKKGGDPLVHKGEAQSLSGEMAVAYATYQANGEPETAQLKRFADVMRGILRKISSDQQSATLTIQSLAQILDPPLTDKDLGAFLAKLSDLAKGGDYTSTVLPVEKNGTLSEATNEKIVKDVLGGTGKTGGGASEDDTRVAVRNATGKKDLAQKARVTLVNGGYTFVDGSSTDTVATSAVTYADEKNKGKAVEIARTLGLKDAAVKKGKVGGNAPVSVVLGEDYTGK
ncbi:LytR C-terminal domain-containing protein [Streptomyces sp. NPDC058426]|uniref:LCP family protein n=1 Tax=Streptomyces sp. NPDC058426 TaxID=3346493 RepID=UPI0036611C1A